jgi:hypothetical protein
MDALRRSSETNNRLRLFAHKPILRKIIAWPLFSHAQVSQVSVLPLHDLQPLSPSLSTYEFQAPPAF